MRALKWEQQCVRVCVRYGLLRDPAYHGVSQPAMAYMQLHAMGKATCSPHW